MSAMGSISLMNISLLNGAIHFRGMKGIETVTLAKRSLKFFDVKFFSNTCLKSFFSSVYPQKQQYAYGYAYPGPYYHGSQYGPYNY